LELNPENGSAVVHGDRRVRLLQEWFGYTLLCDGRFQKFLLMLGEGSNGKGVIQSIWTQMLGEENVSSVSLDDLGGRFSLQPLVGKMANICGDLCEGILKRLTGQDNITVDRKNQSLITITPNVKLIFAANTLPRFSDKSRGIWRRLIVMPFRIAIPEEQQNELLVEELTEELPGILNWAIRGLRRLLQQGHFSSCVICNAAANQHRYDCDPVAQFLDETGLYHAPADAPRRIKKDPLYVRYSEWCIASGSKAFAKNGFNRLIGKLQGVGSHRATTGKRDYYWSGIGDPLTTPPPNDGEAEDQ
jgi:putative DNA primase/helicase